MGNPVVTVLLAATRSSSTGSNIGPGLPIILALAVIGVIVYLVRQRRRRPPD